MQVYPSLTDEVASKCSSMANNTSPLSLTLSSLSDSKFQVKEQSSIPTTVNNLSSESSKIDTKPIHKKQGMDNPDIQTQDQTELKKKVDSNEDLKLRIGKRINQ